MDCARDEWKGGRKGGRKEGIGNSLGGQQIKFGLVLDLFPLEGVPLNKRLDFCLSGTHSPSPLTHRRSILESIVIRHRHRPTTVVTGWVANIDVVADTTK